jgi:putative ABC transport system ATP-binding protein
MAGTPLITLENVDQTFDDGRIVALRQVSLAIAPGESVAVTGPSGSGKSSLVLLMCGIRTPSTGTVRWNGNPMREPSAWTRLRRFEIGIVFQDFNLFPTLTAAENIEMPLLGSGLSSGERRRRIDTALEAVDLRARAGHLPHQLSGGERQRVAIARSIINNPSLILADEPTGNLDSDNAGAIMDLLFGLHDGLGTTLVVVTHDPQYARRCARRIEIKDGRIAAPAAASAASEPT